MTLPTFHNTEEALAFGLKATEEEREALRERREGNIARATIANLEGMKQYALDLLCLAQFDREALEADLIKGWTK